MLASRGGLEIFWANGLVGTIMTLAVAGLAWSLLGAVRQRLFPPPAPAVAGRIPGVEERS
jgi:hypothetical protein